MYAFDAIEPVSSAAQYGRLSAGRAPRYVAPRRGTCNSEVGMRSWDASSGQAASQVAPSCLCNV
jgi:hypothetical protein